MYAYKNVENLPVNILSKTQGINTCYIHILHSASILATFTFYTDYMLCYLRELPTRYLFFEFTEFPSKCCRSVGTATWFRGSNSAFTGSKNCQLKYEKL